MGLIDKVKRLAFGPPPEPEPDPAEDLTPDDTTIHHCPVCGSGNVIGGSDGTIECGFCHLVFVVYLRPQHAFMPRTPTGGEDFPGAHQDYDTPLSPDAPVGAPVAPGAEAGIEQYRVDAQSLAAPAGGGLERFRVAATASAMHTDNGTPTIPMNRTASLPTRIECGGCGLTLRLGWATGQVTAEVPSNGRKGQHYRPAHEVTNDTLTLDRDDNVCEWECPHCLYADSIDLQGHVLGASTEVGFRTDTGQVLSREDYIRHLAIRHADDRDAVIERVRTSRG